MDPKICLLDNINNFHLCHGNAVKFEEILMQSQKMWNIKLEILEWGLVKSLSL